AIRTAVQEYMHNENWLFLGRGYNYPTALEGALKLKEISYIHAEGMPAAEMKHGPIALITEGMPAVFIANEGDEEIRKIADDVMFIPEVAEPLSPMLAVVPLQLIAYHAAVLRGHDVD